MISTLVNRLSSPSPSRSSRSSSSKSNASSTTSSSSSQNIFTRSRSSNANNFNKFKRSQLANPTNEAKIQIAPTHNHTKKSFIINHIRMSNSSPSSMQGSPSHTSALPPIPTGLFSNKMYQTSPRANQESCLSKPFESMNINAMESENSTAQSIYYSKSETVTQKKVEVEVEKLMPTTHRQITEPRFADEPEYRMDHKRRGFAIIINNKIFDSKLEMPKREGTDKDAASLELVLTKLGFDIRLFHNCTAITMRDLLLRYAKADHSEADCFMCVIMSHGEDGVIYGVDKEIEIENIIQPFKLNRTLAGKPKLFFIQACRGTKLMEGIDSNPFEVNYVSKIPMEADFLIGYSTIAGYFSWRNSANGSWFIQSLCHVLNEYGKSLEIMQMLTAVNRRVAYYYESNTTDPQMHGKRQVPCIVTMLTKELYFKPKQSRYPHTLTVNYD